MEFNFVKERVETAITEFINNDAYLLEVNANERSMTHRLAIYLQEQFQEWNVDCEYNRNLADAKRVHLLKEQLGIEIHQIDTDDDSGQTVYPDIIVHHRGKNEDNLLIIEAKKSTSNIDEERDHLKLIAYREAPLNYKYGLFLKFIVGENPDIETAWENNR